MSATAADYVAHTSAQAGVKRVFGVVGDSFNGFTDALRREQAIEWVHMRHEEGAAFAAGAEAHLTGELAVRAGSCGPGNLHLINGLFDCQRSGVPVLAIAARAMRIAVARRGGKEHIEYDNPYDVGMTGLVGFASGYEAMKGCDTLLVLGADFPYRQFFPEQANIAQIDVRPEALGNRCPLAPGVLGGVKQTLDALLPKLTAKHDGAFLAKARADYVEARKDLDRLAVIDAGTRAIHPQAITRLVSELADDDAIFTCDVGTPIAWAARYLKLNGKRRLVGSFNHGSMANAMLHAIGAQASHPDRQVISLSGDGGFAMMMGEFLTLLQLDLPVKIIVLNNGTLGFVELEMKANGFLDTGCDLKNPNFAAMAEAMGVKGIRVEDPQALEGALREALAHNGPVLVDVVSARQELIMPPHATLDEAHKFGLFMIKAVLDGRAGELIDLAKVNLLR